MRRLGIFAFYEKNGDVEDYICFLLQDLKKTVERLVIVCNGELSLEGEKKFSCYTEEIILRENKGYDIGAFQDILLHYLGKDEVLKYDAVVLCNDTFFGPFIPFSEIFAEMEERGLDFWGLSAQPESIDFWGGANRTVPAFIHSFFFVIQSRMLQDDRFWVYWQGLRVQEWNVTQVVVRHEQYFTFYFESIGYCWGVYTDHSFLTGTLEDNAYTTYMALPYELIRYGRCPFLKKKCLTGKDAGQGLEPDNGSVADAVDYIKQYTSYDVGLIIDYMLRHCSKRVIAEKLRLSYVVSDDSVWNEACLEMSHIGIVICLDFPILKDMLFHKIRNLSKKICIQYGKSGDAKNMIWAFPQEVQYICVIRDALLKEQVPACTEISYGKVLCENLLKNDVYITNVISLFDKDRYLGLLKIPTVRFGGFWECEESDSFQEGSYWVRREALGNFQKYYIGTLYERSYTGLLLGNQEIMLQTVLRMMDCEKSITNMTSYFRERLFSYCRKQKCVYLYGAGGVAARTAQALIHEKICFAGFVISEGQKKENTLLEHPIWYLSEVKKGSDIGFVVAVEERLWKEITDTLQAYGFHNFIYSSL